MREHRDGAGGDLGGSRALPPLREWLDLAELTGRELLEHATPGPWRRDDHYLCAGDATIADFVPSPRTARAVQAMKANAELAVRAVNEYRHYLDLEDAIRAKDPARIRAALAAIASHY